MDSALTHLETRRKIIFADHGLTLRDLAGDSVLLTVGPSGASKNQVHAVEAFLRNHFRNRQMRAIIVDLSNVNCILIENILAVSKIKVNEFETLAFSINNRLLNFSLHLLTFRKKSPNTIKIFTNFNRALSWSLSR